MESNDFQDGIGQASSGYDPTSLTNPWVLFTAIALAVLLLVLGYYFGDRMAISQEDSRRRRHLETIWKKIHESARTALAAPKLKVPGAAQDLLDLINKHLGPVVALGTLSDAVHGLEDALAGRSGHEHHDGHGDHGAHGQKQTAKNEADGHAESGDHGQAQSQAQSSPSQINITISNRGAGDAARPGHAPADPSGLDIDRIRRAVSRFHDYWDRPETRQQLRDAQRALI